MDISSILQELKSNQTTFQSLLQPLTPAMYLWKSSSEKWCILEIVSHLYDEEMEDFRARLHHVLTTPEQELPQIDPEGWVSSRNYLANNYQSTLDNFLAARSQSLEWLEHLENPNWKQYYLHPTYGKLPAKMFLTNWLAHDYLHIRQIIKTKYDYLKHSTGDPLLYAGTW